MPGRLEPEGCQPGLYERRSDSHSRRNGSASITDPFPPERAQRRLTVFVSSASQRNGFLAKGALGCAVSAAAAPIAALTLIVDQFVLSY